MAGHDDSTEDDWMPEESARLASLPKTRIAPNELKVRTTEALHRQGLLGSRSATRPARILALIAAASLIFISGALVGFAAARRTTEPSGETRAVTAQDVARAGGAASNNSPTRHVVWY
jgi:hypothetical protein